MNKKILFNTWNAAFFIKGGGEVQLLKSKESLEKRGFHIDFYNMWNPQTDFDIFHQFSSVEGVEQVIDAYKKLGKKIVMSPIFWDELTEEYPLHHYYKRLFSKIDLLMTNSHAESEKIGRLFNIPPERFQKTRNSVSDEYLTVGQLHLFKEKYNIDTPFILTVANIDERKNTERLVRACEVVGIQLVSIGNVRHQNCYDKVKDSPYFTHLGPITDVEVLKSAYRSCTVFALPSMCETPGIAALEAASQGAKIVITQEGPTKEYFQEFATYVDPWSIESIASAIHNQIISKNSTQQAISHISSLYTWDNTAKDIDAGYSRLY